MQITGELVKYLEKLGRIQLTPEQENATEKDLQEILSYMETLNELEPQGVEPLSHSFPVTNVFHEDEVIPSMDREALLANAPNQKDGCFQVPKTVE